MKLALLLALSCLLVLGCSSDSEEEDGSGGGSSTGGTSGTGGTGGGDSGDGCGDFCTAAACCNCSASECTTPYDSCRCEPDCIDLIDCVRACSPGDTSCQNGCYSSHPLGYQPYVALESCASTYCVSECFGGSGDAG